MLSVCSPNFVRIIEVDPSKKVQKLVPAIVTIIPASQTSTGNEIRLSSAQMVNPENGVTPDKNLTKLWDDQSDNTEDSEESSAKGLTDSDENEEEEEEEYFPVTDGSGRFPVMMSRTEAKAYLDSVQLFNRLREEQKHLHPSEKRREERLERERQEKEKAAEEKAMLALKDKSVAEAPPGMSWEEWCKWKQTGIAPNKNHAPVGQQQQVPSTPIPLSNAQKAMSKEEKDIEAMKEERRVKNRKRNERRKMKIRLDKKDLQALQEQKALGGDLQHESGLLEKLTATVDSLAALNSVQKKLNVVDAATPARSVSMAPSRGSSTYSSRPVQTPRPQQRGSPVDMSRDSTKQVSKKGAPPAVSVDVDKIDPVHLPMWMVQQREAEKRAKANMAPGQAGKGAPTYHKSKQSSRTKTPPPPPVKSRGRGLGVGINAPMWQQSPSLQKAMERSAQKAASSTSPRDFASVRSTTSVPRDLSRAPRDLSRRRG